MRTRLRWICLPEFQKVQLDELRKILASREYSKRGSSGFILAVVSSSIIEGEYIEKHEVSEKVTDPFGEISEFKRTEYSHAPFRLQSKTPQLELWDASSETVHSLINLLTTLDAPRLSVREAEIDPMRWFSRFVQRVDGGEVLSMTASEIPVSPATSAKVALAGALDVRDDFSRFIRKRKYRLEKIQSKMRFQDREFKVELLFQCRCVISPASEKLREAARVSLQECLGDKTLDQQA